VIEGNFSDTGASALKPSEATTRVDDKDSSEPRHVVGK
jgi:hypothetical protein